MTTYKKIGTDLTIINYSTKQKGYGRQALFLEFLEVEGTYYIKDVFPNVMEHFDICLSDNAFFNEETGKYINGNGNGEYNEDEVYDSIEDALNAILKDEEIEIDEDDEDDDNN